MQKPLIILDNKEITIVQFSRVDGVAWPFTIRMTLRFSTNNYRLSAKQTNQLQWMAAVCQQGDRIIETYGMADRAGASAYNLALSKRRIGTTIALCTEFKRARTAGVLVSIRSGAKKGANAAAGVMVVIRDETLGLGQSARLVKVLRKAAIGPIIGQARHKTGAQIRTHAHLSRNRRDPRHFIMAFSPGAVKAWR